MPHPDGLPDLFLDRSLGRVTVPRLLRDEGLRLVSLAERYGVPQDESISDERWLREAGERGEAVLMKDARVRYNPAEKGAVLRYRVRCFCLVRRDLTAEAMAGRFLRNLDAMSRACESPGPFLYIVHERRIVRAPLEWT